MEMKSTTESTAGAPLILDIKRMALQDGPGIRTCFFVKGCPLRCIWCHNPESQRKEAQEARFPHLCLKCENCEMDESTCPGHAFKRYGRKIPVDELIEKALEDKAFYEESGGGITLSGGEPLLFPEWSAKFFGEAKAAGLHTCIDTSLFAGRQAVEKVRGTVDMWLADFKVFDEKEHIRLTGVSNAPVIDNLKYLAGRGERMEIRLIVVPGCNDGEDLAMRHRFLDSIGIARSDRVELAYHDYARTKYAALGMADTMP